MGEPFSHSSSQFNLVMESYQSTAKRLFERLQELEHSENDLSKRGDQAIQIISKTLQVLRKEVRETGFNSIESEIQFFKCIKPKITGHLIFYRHVFELESKRLMLPCIEVEKHITYKKRQFNQLIKDNIEFVFYYRNQHTNMDKLYFLRESDRVPLLHQNTDALYDPEFTTAYDHIAAKLVAKELFEHYLEPIEKESTKQVSNLQWTESKASLVELIYALNESGAINGGKTDIKTICAEFEKIFNFELKDVYSTYRDISLRKTNRKKFLTKLSGM
ncbi:MAG: hypothetical protein ACJA1C_002148 [Crocinitomicaceae bacterium]|jgi:hypothetical protein